jgi:hypothetical protein
MLATSEPKRRGKLFILTSSDPDSSLRIHLYWFDLAVTKNSLRNKRFATYCVPSKEVQCSAVRALRCFDLMGFAPQSRPTPALPSKAFVSTPISRRAKGSGAAASMARLRHLAQVECCHSCRGNNRNLLSRAIAIPRCIWAGDFWRCRKVAVVPSMARLRKS